MPVKPPAVGAWTSAPPGIPYLPLSFVADRPMIKAVGTLFHTNGALGPGSIQSAINWAESKPGTNTAPHYQVQRDGTAAKLLPSNRKGIGNFTLDWSFLIVENQDLGWPVPGPIPWTAAQLETNARILAWEHLISGGALPLTFVDPNVKPYRGYGSHTDPLGYPISTKYDGKPCPGDAVKYQVRNYLGQRARALVAEWTGQTPTPPAPPPVPVPPEETDMQTFLRGDGKNDNPNKDVFPYPTNSGAVWELMPSGVLRHVTGAEDMLRREVEKAGGDKYVIGATSQAWIDAYPFKRRTEDIFDDDADVRVEIARVLNGLSVVNADLTAKIAALAAKIDAIQVPAPVPVVPGTVFKGDVTFAVSEAVPPTPNAE